VARACETMLGKRREYLRHIFPEGGRGEKNRGGSMGVCGNSGSGESLGTPHRGDALWATGIGEVLRFGGVGRTNSESSLI